MQKHLFIPGPIDVREAVLERMATPMIGHRSKEATALQSRIAEKLQTLMETKHVIILSTSSGSGLMESAIRSTTRKKTAVFSVGAFGDRWYDMARANNVPADLFQSERGEPTTPEMVDEVLATGEYDVVTVTHNETSTGIVNPIGAISDVVKKYPDVLFLVDAVSSMGGDRVPVDEWGIDICISSTQKCIGLPPGMSFASVSQRAYEAAQQVEFRGFYFDLVKIYKMAQEKAQYPSTPSLSHMFALDYQLEQMLHVEGLEQRYARHARLANRVQSWAQQHFGLFAKEGYRSNTVTCIENTKGVDVSQLNEKLAPLGFVISGGYGKYKTDTFRISHMGDTQDMLLEELLSSIDSILGF